MSLVASGRLRSSSQSVLESMWNIISKMLLPILFAICAPIAATQVNFEEFKSSLATFSSKLYEQCVQTETENVIISPYSVLNSLVLLSQAANGNSFEELKQVLHLVGEKSDNADEYPRFDGIIKRNAGNATLLTANQIYVKQGYQLNSDFKKVATEKFSSGVESVDFSKSAEAAQTINNFVEEKTNNKIKDLISPDSLDPDTRVVLVNAIYMKAKWEYEFKRYETYQRDFYANDVEKTSVDFMHTVRSENYGVLADLDASVLELKYADSDFAFVIILPNDQTGLSALEDKLRNYDLKEISQKSSKQLVDISIPKFKIDYEVHLKDALGKLGISSIFEDGKADLSGLLDGDESLFVSDVVHKAFIEVNEEGTEAAAATGIIAVPTSALVVPKETPKFHADHPFLYHIWDSTTKSILFSGRVVQLK